MIALLLFSSGAAFANNPIVPAGNGFGFTHGQLVISRNGQITAAPDRTSATHTHVGLDISAPRGSEIFSFAPGIVVKTISEPTSCNPRVAPQPEWCYLGYMVLIRHSIGFDRTYYTLYLHMESPPLVRRTGVRNRRHSDWRGRIDWSKLRATYTFRDQVLSRAHSIQLGETSMALEFKPMEKL